MHSFYLLSSIPSYGHINLFICSAGDEHLGCFQFVAITSKAAKHIYDRSLHGYLVLISYSKYLRLESLDYVVDVSIAF